MAINYSAMIEQAVEFELDGNLEEALRLWQATLGAFAITSTTKDGHTVSFSESMRQEKIDQLERRIMRAGGFGKMRRVPVVKEPTTYPGEYLGDSYGPGLYGNY